MCKRNISSPTWEIVMPLCVVFYSDSVSVGRSVEWVQLPGWDLLVWCKTLATGTKSEISKRPKANVSELSEATSSFEYILVYLKLPLISKTTNLQLKGVIHFTFQVLAGLFQWRRWKTRCLWQENYFDYFVRQIGFASKAIKTHQHRRINHIRICWCMNLVDAFHAS